MSRLRARGDEVIVLRVASRLELGLGSADAARYYDPEHPDRIVSADPGSDPAFRERVAAYYDELRLGLVERGAEYVPLTTDQPLLSAIGGWLMARAQNEPVSP